VKSDFLEHEPRTARAAMDIAVGGLALVFRGVAFIVFILMSLAEPFLAAVLGTLALGCFFVAVLFGFIFHAYFPHRWYVLGASVVFLLLYFLYRFAMQGVQRTFR
jgi:ABC-type Fe3+-siderophore transport system permease subunit